MVSEVLSDKKMSVFFIIESGKVKFTGLSASLDSDIGCFAFLLGEDSSNRSFTKL